MKKWVEARGWHLWVGLILALPVFIVGITAVFIAHEKTLGLDHLEIGTGWLPGIDDKSEKMKMPELRAHILLPDGERLLALKYGVLRLDGPAPSAVDALQGIEVRDWLLHDGVLYAATKQGLYRRDAGAWRNVLKMDLWTVGASTAGLETMSRKAMWRSHDGIAWAMDESLAGVLENAPAGAVREPYTVKKLNMDLHTGKALLGHFDWLWMDIVGGAVALLTLTGVWTWWRRRAA